jgi:hypothetical protein
VLAFGCNPALCSYPWLTAFATPIVPPLLIGAAVVLLTAIVPSLGVWFCT